MSNVRQVAIADAKRIALEYDFDQVVIIARRVGDAPDCGEAVTTYGRNAEHCDVAARIGDYLKYEIMKWERDDG